MEGGGGGAVTESGLQGRQEGRNRGNVQGGETREKERDKTVEGGVGMTGRGSV